MASTRRLAAILAADVAGYSRLMGADEEGTHERLKAHLGELVEPKIGEHRGRIVKTTGDGLLAEFASVVDAVRCAGEIQGAMADRDLDLADRWLIALIEEAEKLWPHSCSVIAFTLRVETPCTYISASAATSARSERW